MEFNYLVYWSQDLLICTLANGAPVADHVHVVVDGALLGAGVLGQNFILLALVGLQFLGGAEWLKRLLLSFICFFRSSSRPCFLGYDLLQLHIFKVIIDHILEYFDILRDLAHVLVNFLDLVHHVVKVLLIKFRLLRHAFVQEEFIYHFDF